MKWEILSFVKSKGFCKSKCGFVFFWGIGTWVVARTVLCVCFFLVQVVVDGSSYHGGTEAVPAVPDTGLGSHMCCGVGERDGRAGDEACICYRECRCGCRACQHLGGLGQGEDRGEALYPH